MLRAQSLTRSVIGVAVGASLLLAGCSSATSPNGGSGGSGGSGGGAGTGTGQQSQAGKKLRIGFSPYDLRIPAFKGLADGLSGAAKSQGDTVVTSDPKGDPSTQLQQLQQWVQLKQVDAIWTIPVSTKTVAPVISQAVAKGIVVIAAGAPSDYGLSKGAPGITFTSVDYKAYGTKLAELASACIKQRLGGNGKVIYLRAQSGAQSNAVVNSSFKTGLKSQSSGSEIVNQQDATTRLAAQQAVASALQGNPSANALVATNDEGGLGGQAAFQQANKSPKSTCVVSAGGTDEAIKDVKAGKLYGEVAFDFIGDLTQNYKQIKIMAANPKAAGASLVTPIKTITG